MSRILFLSQVLPFPLDAGPKVRSYNVLRYLTRHHQVHLLAFKRPDDKKESIAHLERFCDTVNTVTIHRSQTHNLRSLVRSLLTGQSFIICRDHMTEMVQKLDWLVDQSPFDAIHSDQLWMAQYALRASNSQKWANSKSLVLDEHNACFQIYQRLVIGERNPLLRMLLEREWRVLHLYEAQACAQFDHVITVTEEDRHVLQALVNNQRSKATSPRFSTIPICIDVQTIQPVKPNVSSKNILHLGTMFWIPNVEGVLWFTREVWPRILTQIPDATFTIVGKKPPKSIQNLAAVKYQQSEKNKLFTTDTSETPIRVTGYVSEPRPYLEKAGAFVVPLLSGGGMRVKILDAWSFGLPVISTTIGAEGIQVINGENILIADSPEDFANAVVRVLSDLDLAQKLRLDGRRWVEDHYDWQQVYQAWDRVYSSNFEI